VRDPGVTGAVRAGIGFIGWGMKKIAPGRSELTGRRDAPPADPEPAAGSIPFDQPSRPVEPGGGG
jgi:hypothetical protein